MLTELRKDKLWFPDVSLADEDGLLAYGGDLSTERLLLAYSKGIFPWYNDDTPILWYSPHKRFVLFPEEIRITKSMKQIIKSGRFVMRRNFIFREVVRSCSLIQREGQYGSWITPDMQKAYIELHNKGYAHSFESWYNDYLAGGLYGVEVGSIFCGESMFSNESNASKAALIWLCTQFNYKLIDCQMHTTHLESMGARMISREEYETYLK